MVGLCKPQMNGLKSVCATIYRNVERKVRADVRIFRAQLVVEQVSMMSWGARRVVASAFGVVFPTRPVGATFSGWNSITQ